MTSAPISASEAAHAKKRGKKVSSYRPDGGSAVPVETQDDAYFPSAAVDLGEDNDTILRLARDQAMTQEGFKSLPDEDDAPTGGVGQKAIEPK